MAIKRCYPSNTLLFPSTYLFPSVCTVYRYGEVQEFDSIAKKIVFDIREASSSPGLLLKLYDSEGAPLDITDVATAKFTMVDSDGAVVINEQSAVVNCRTEGSVVYWFSTTDTATAGSYFGYFTLRNAAGTGVLRIPESNNLWVEVNDK